MHRDTAISNGNVRGRTIEESILSANGPYCRSITNQRKDAPLPYEMNGTPIPRNHTEQIVMNGRIHDVTDLGDIPSTFIRMPNTRSWSSFRDQSHHDNRNKNPPHRRCSGRDDSPVSPFTDHPLRQHSPDTHREIFPPPDSNDRDRNPSHATVFPGISSDTGQQHCPRSGKVADSNESCGKSIGTHHTVANHTNVFRSAKDIYHHGPKGEGQKLWRSYKQVKKDKHLKVEVLSNHGETFQAQRDRPAPQRPERSAAEPFATKPPPVHRKETVREHKTPTTTYEVPVLMSPNVDINKPLPPIPQGLPPKTNHNRSEERKNQHWWHSKPPKDKFKDRNHDLKSKISRPQLIEHDNGYNNSNNFQNIGNTSPRTVPVIKSNSSGKGKQDPSSEGPSPSHWSERFSPHTEPHSKMKFPHFFAGRDRQDSDTSFACAGFADEYRALVRDPTSLRHNDNASVTDDERLLPEPLFSGTRGGKGREKDDEDGGARDSMFYDMYHEVLREYR